MKRWDKGSELRITERLSLLVHFFFFAAIHPTFKHAPRKESTIKRSVDDLELFDDQRRNEVPGSFDFCHHSGVVFAS